MHVLDLDLAGEWASHQPKDFEIETEMVVVDLAVMELVGRFLGKS